MSFAGSKQFIEVGDEVIIYINPTRLYRATVKAKVPNKTGQLVDNIIQTQFGHLNVPQLIGKQYGIKLKLPKGWVILLQPTPDLWVSCLPHRTQIIYASDISMILLKLDVKPGCVVVESGTGSGALSHAFIRAVQPTGYLHTYDFHESRIQQATEEFRDHGVSRWVTVHQADAYVDGFKLDRIADVVFLDLPKPWEAIPHAAKCLKKGGRFCSFSPCVEQVQKACLTLAANGFDAIRTMEIVHIERQVVGYTDDELDLMCLHAAKSSQEASNFIPKDSTDSTQVMRTFLKQVAGDDGEVEAPNITKKFTSFPSSQKGHSGYLTFATYDESVTG